MTLKYYKVYSFFFAFLVILLFLPANGQAQTANVGINYGVNVSGSTYGAGDSVTGMPFTNTNGVGWQGFYSTVGLGLNVSPSGYTGGTPIANGLQALTSSVLNIPPDQNVNLNNYSGGNPTLLVSGLGTVNGQSNVIAGPQNTVLSSVSFGYTDANGVSHIEQVYIDPSQLVHVFDSNGTVINVPAGCVTAGSTCTIVYNFVQPNPPVDKCAEGQDPVITTTYCPGDGTLCTTTQHICTFADSTSCQPTDRGICPCVSNGVCESGLGENANNCPVDCGPDFTISVSPSTQTVAPGGTSQNYTVTLTPKNGYNKQVKLSLDGWYRSSGQDFRWSVGEDYGTVYDVQTGDFVDKPLGTVTVNANATVTFVLVTSANTPLNEYTITVNANEVTNTPQTIGKQHFASTKLVVAGACTTLTYNPAKSGFSPSNITTGPTSASSITVNPGDRFYAYVDYGAYSDSIYAPYTTGYACAWDSNAGVVNGTVYRFDCVANPTTPGNYSYVTGIAHYPPPGSNFCLSGPTTVGTVTVAGLTPTISLSSAMDFYGYRNSLVGNTNYDVTPAGQTLTISNTGSGSMSWTATAGASWCHLSKASGTIAAGRSDNVTVTVDAPSNMGSFSCPITVTSPNSTNAGHQQQINATYHVAGCQNTPVPASSSLPNGTNSTSVSQPGVVGAYNVYFPTWSNYNGQDDLNSSWSSPSTGEKGVKQGSVDPAAWNYTSDLTQHPTGGNPYDGVINTHTYIQYNPSGSVAFCGVTSYTVQASAVCTASGSILRQYWTGIGGTNVSDLTSNSNYPNNPSGSSQPTSFEAPSNWSDSYGTRMFGTVKPAITGAYTFYIASDDNSELWLGTNSNASSKVKIASVTGYTGSREWTKYASQKSASINLTANQTYYIEALQKEGGGGDNLAVGWTIPGSSTIDVIPGACLNPGTALPPPTPTPTPTPTYSLTVTKAGSGSGTVTSNPAGVSCGATCNFSFTSGTSVTLSASASGGSTFAGWSGSGCSGTGNCVVSMTQARSVTATFNITPTPTPTPIPTPTPVVGTSNNGVDATVACNNIRVKVTDKSTTEDGFAIFRNTTNTPSAATRIATITSTTKAGTGTVYTLSPDDNVGSSGTYYYWAQAYIGTPPSALSSTASDYAASSPPSLSPTACQANLGGSDKDITSINGNNLSYSSCNGTDKLPTATVLKLGYKVTFSINLCNSGTANATSVSVTDTMTNLKKPSAGYNALYDPNGAGGQPLSNFGITLTETTTNGQPQIIFGNLPQIAAGAIGRIIFTAELTVPTDFTGNTSRFENSLSISYSGGPSSPIFKSTPLIPFIVGPGSPIIIEQP